MTISKFPFLIPHSADKGEAKYIIFTFHFFFIIPSF